MLGQVRRTTRTDVGLAISFTGVGYLVWALVVGSGSHLAQELAALAQSPKVKFPPATAWFYHAFAYGQLVWNVLGLLWLVLALALIIGASRQRWSISWAWMVSTCQVMAGTLLAVWAALAVRAPYVAALKLHENQPPSPAPAWTAMSISLAIALLVWVTVLIWLLTERARLARGPSLRDSLRTHSS